MSSDAITIFHVPRGMNQRDIETLLVKQAGVAVKSIDIVPNTNHIRVTFKGAVDVREVSRICRSKKILVLPEIYDTAEVRVNAEWFALIVNEGLKLDTIVKSDVRLKQSQTSLVIEGKLSSVEEALSSIQATVVQKYEEIAIADLASDHNHGQMNGIKSMPNDYTGKSVDHSDRDRDKNGDDDNYKSKSGDRDHSDRDVGKTSDQISGDKFISLETSHAGTSADKDMNLKVIENVTLNNTNKSPTEQGTGALLDSDPSLRTHNGEGFAVGIQTEVIEEHLWNYLKFRSPKNVENWEALLSPRRIASSGVVQLRGTMEDLETFIATCEKFDLFTLTRMMIDVPVEVGSNVVEDVAHQGRVSACRTPSGVFELTGRRERVLKVKTQLEDIFTTVKHKHTAASDASFHSLNSSSSSPKAAMSTVSSVSLSAVTVSSGVKNGLHPPYADDETTQATHSSLPVNGTSKFDNSRDAVVGVSSRSTGSIRFETPLARLRVEVFTGDLTLQHVDVIVNAANGLLQHAGGAAKAIARAAGIELLTESERYIRIHGQIKTSEVMHTSSGRLRPLIKYVIHAVGPNYTKSNGDTECRRLLERTFHNCFVYANDKLRCTSMAIPAISSGTYGVPWDIVSSAAYNALMSFDSYLASLRTDEKCLTRISFVNIDTDITKHLIDKFTALIGTVCPSSTPRTSANDRKQESTSASDAVKLRVGGSNSQSASKVKQPMKALSTSDDVVQGQDTADHRITCCVCNKVIDSTRLMMSTKSCKHVDCGRSTCRNSPCTKCYAMKPQQPSVSKVHVDETAKPEDVNHSTDIATAARAKRRRSFSGSVDTSPTNKDNLKTSKDESKDDSTHVADDDEFKQTGSSLRRSASFNLHDRKKPQCIICMDDVTSPKTLACKHTFCTECIDEAFKHAPKCPCCGRIFSALRGNQPEGGTMKVSKSRDDLSGFKGAGSIVIEYNIPAGLQTNNHPNPGKYYKGTSRTAYLPGNAEGQEICELLCKAFSAGLVFTIGRSNTTGEDNVVVWNDIHHKTNKSGTYGYPDFTYLSRVRSELAAKGITSLAVSTTATPSTSSTIGVSTSSVVTGGKAWTSSLDKPTTITGSAGRVTPSTYSTYSIGIPTSTSASVSSGVYSSARAATSKDQGVYSHSLDPYYSTTSYTSRNSSGYPTTTTSSYSSDRYPYSSMIGSSGSTTRYATAMAASTYNSDAYRFSYSDVTQRFGAMTATTSSTMAGGNVSSSRLASADTYSSTRSRDSVKTSGIAAGSNFTRTSSLDRSSIKGYSTRGTPAVKSGWRN